MVFWYLFDFITKKVNNINIILKYLSLKAISEKINQEKALFNCFNKSKIWNFGNT